MAESGVGTEREWRLCAQKKATANGGRMLAERALIR